MVPIFGGRPIAVMIVSQALNAVILPATVGGIIYLTNRKDLMGKYKNTALTNMFLVLILLFSIFTSVIGIRGLIDTLSSL